MARTRAKGWVSKEEARLPVQLPSSCGHGPSGIPAYVVRDADGLIVERPGKMLICTLAEADELFNEMEARR